MIIITNHAKKRIKKRLGLNKNIIQSITEQAYNQGIKHRDTKGSLNRYITSLYFKHKSANNCRIFKEKIFIFENNILITILDLPNKYKKYNKE